MRKSGRNRDARRDARRALIAWAAINACACGKIAANNPTAEPPAPAAPPTLTYEVVAEGPRTTATAGSATVLEGGDGRLSGARVVFPAGALPDGAVVRLDEVTRPTAFSGLPGVTPVSAAVHVAATGIDGAAVTAATLPGTATLPIDEGSLGLGEDLSSRFDELCVVEEAADGTLYQWRRPLLRVDAEGRTLTLQFTPLGVFQVGLCAGDLGDLARDAKTEGVAGDYVPLASMRVVPSDFPGAAGATHACLYLAGAAGGFVDATGMPFATGGFTLHLVNESALLSDGADYGVTVRFTSAACSLGADGYADRSAVLAEYGPFNVAGGTLKGGASGALLGQPDGVFPLTHVSLHISTGADFQATDAAAQAACLEASTADGQILGSQPLSVQGAALNGVVGSYLFWFIPSKDGAHHIELRLGADCSAATAPAKLAFEGVAGGAELAANAVPMAIRLFDEDDMPVATDAAPVDICVDAYADDDSTSLIGSFDMRALPPAQDTTDPDYEVATTFAYFPAAPTPGRYRLELFGSQTCAAVRNGAPFVKPASVDALLPLDVHQS